MNIGTIAPALAIFLAFSACGDTQDSDRAQKAEEAIQQGLQKEKALMEGMQKGVEDLQKQMTEQKEKGQ